MQIQLHDLHFTYPGGVAALAGVSLALQPGESVALVGANGSGKTTLARCLNGLLRPQLGRIQLGDWDVAAHSPAQIARRLAYVFQNPDEQLFQARIWDEVAFGPRNLGYPAAQVSRLVAQALAWLGLSDLARANPRDLGYSGRKLVALAGGLAMDTPVLVLDEPTAGLDAGQQARLAQALTALKQQGKTLLVITHDMDFAAENLARFVLLQQGVLALDAPAENFFQQRQIFAAGGLLAPQIARLSERLGKTVPALTVQQFLDENSRSS